ncbi:MAG: HEAT repeat domain-containing protein [Promethearchaeota archaeon]|jgi:DNA repair exonuclease SbcCD ATPase subunit
MSKEIKDKINSVDSANRAHSDLEIKIKSLKEEIQRLNFTVNEQKKIIQTQKSQISNNNVPEDVSVLKDLVTEQRQDLIKKDKDVEILQQTIADISSELDNAQKFEDEDKELIYANKEIVQLTEENEAYKKQIEELNSTIKGLQNGKSNATPKAGEENPELIEAKKLIIKLTEENGIHRVQVESSRHEIADLKRRELESETLKNQYFQELNEVNKILDQLSYDNDQYHEKVKYLQQKLEETVQLQEEQVKEVEIGTSYEEINQKLFDLEVENKELKDIINANVKIIEDLQQQFGEKVKMRDQQLEELRQKAEEKEDELNSTNLRLQKIENANRQLSDLIVELKVLEDSIEDRVEKITSPKPTIIDNYPPTLFFKMYKMLSNDYKALVVNQLIGDLKSVNRDSRTYAIKILSKIGGSKIFSEFKSLVNDDDWIVKLYLIKALSNFESRESIELLNILQEDGDPDVREASIEMISKLKIV